MGGIDKRLNCLINISCTGTEGSVKIVVLSLSRMVPVFSFDRHTSQSIIMRTDWFGLIIIYFVYGKFEISSSSEMGFGHKIQDRKEKCQ